MTDSAGTMFSAQRVSWDEVCAIRAEWERLAENAADPNIFLDPGFAVSAARAMGVANELQAMLVWKGPKEDRDLVGLMPFRRRNRWKFPFPIVEVWTHPYAPACLPLVHTSCAEDATVALFDAVSADPTLPGIVLLPMLSLDTEFAAALLSVRKPLYVHAGHQRAIAKTDRNGDDYLKTVLTSSRAKKLRQQFNAFAREGDLEFEISERTSVEPALVDFLKLESAGWKGRGGTSLESDTHSAAMAHDAVSALAEMDKVRIFSLRLDGELVAGLIVFTMPGHVWFWKIAYDETHARFSPGKHIFIEAVKAALNETPGTFIDSCAAPDHPLADFVLGEHMAMGDVVVSAGGTAGPAFRTANLLERLRGTARSLRNRIRGDR